MPWKQIDAEPQVLTSGVWEPAPRDNTTESRFLAPLLNSRHFVGSLQLAMMGAFTPQKPKKTSRSHFSSEQVVNASTPLAVSI